MAELKVSVKGIEGKQDFELELKEAQSPEVLAALWGTFQLFNVDIKSVYVASKITKAYKESAKAVESPEPTEEPAKTSLQDFEVDERDNKTPDRIYEGKEQYQAKYYCPQCDNYGRRYVSLRDKYLKCHNCKTPIKLEPASDTHFRDESFNVFTADKHYELEYK